MDIKAAWRALRRRLNRRAIGELQLMKRYEKVHGRPFDPAHVERFTEKVLQRMLVVNRRGNALYSRLSDKYAVRDYVREKVGAEHLVDLIWSGTDPRRIPFDTLPSKCVIKTNNGSGGNILIDGACDRDDVIARLTEWLGKDYYWIDHEYHYAKIKPRVVIEAYLDDGQENGPLDYKLWCFDGVPQLVQVDDCRHGINALYDRDWTLLPFRYRDNQKDFNMPRPANLDRLLEVGARLSEGFDFVRVDLYNVHGQVYFGEMTFTPLGGRMRFRPDEWDLTVGRFWQQAH
ncbi:ATP-grasp fold amidoligase family protein [Methyloversatilis discipulorum]|uniref:ATP-grasp fold amidoligase family protein n=1 Tax=Methyloversatilis discipulorum TaxID=1119528 RepID=UPI00037548D9|nr:ATP-grasp fold amidoligase family protein [Methyloversatilis discipulorum]